MHQKPFDFSQRSWRTAEKIIRFVGTYDGRFEFDTRREISVRQMAGGCEISARTVERILPRLVRDRIIGRHVHRLGRSAAAMTWVYHPTRQIIRRPETVRTPRVAAVLPAIRQALISDRESLRAVAQRFGVSADTVLDERRKVTPYEQGTTSEWQCPGCGAWLTSHECLRCSLVS